MQLSSQQPQLQFRYLMIKSIKIKGDEMNCYFFLACQVCTTGEGVHQSGESWISNESPCVSCHCREGVVTCSKLPCHCTSSSSSSVESTAKSGLNHNRTLVHHPNSEQCCPQCRPNPSSKSECSHQEFPGLTFDSGQRWIYQCQSCECLVLINFNYNLR